LKSPVIEVTREIADEKCSIPSTNIIIRASHTHNDGPTVEWVGDSEEINSNLSEPDFIKYLLKTTPSADKNYLDVLARKIASAINTS